MLDNPVLHKELILRFRLRQSGPARIGGAVTALVGLAIFYYFAFSLLTNSGARTAYDLWGMACGIQFAIVLLTAPALAANAISQEREQQTLELLVSTRLRPFEIVAGKLVGRLVTIGLQLLAFAPVIFLSAMISMATQQSANDAVTPGKFVAAYMVTITTAIFMTSIGIYLSLKVKRTLYAILGSYVVAIGFLTLGTYLVSTIFTSAANGGAASQGLFNVLGLAAAVFAGLGIYLSRRPNPSRLTKLLSYALAFGGIAIVFIVIATMLGGNGSSWETAPALWINPIRMFVGVLQLNEPFSAFSVLFGCVIYSVFSVVIFVHIMNAFRRLARHD